MIKLKEVMILEETIIEEVISNIEIKSLIKWLIILEMIQIKIRYNPTIEKATMVTIEFSIVMKMEVYIILIDEYSYQVSYIHLTIQFTCNAKVCELIFLSFASP